MSDAVAHNPGQAKVVKRGFDVQVTLSTAASDVISTDKQLGRLLNHRSASPSIVQEQHGINNTTDTVGSATSQHSFGHYALKRASLGPHEGRLQTAGLDLHRAETYVSVCADALTAATAAFTLAARLGQEDMFSAKLTAAHAAHDAAVKALQEAEAAYMPNKLHQEIASKAVALETAAYDHEQKRCLGVYQRCKQLHRQHLLAEQAAGTRHGRLTVFSKLQALVNMASRHPAANAVLRPHSRSMPPTPAPQPTALPTAEVAPRLAACSTAEYLHNLANMCKDRWRMEFEQQAAEAADNSDAYHQLRRWRAAWTSDNPQARLRRLAKLIKDRTVPKGLDWGLISSMDITLAVLEGLPWLCRSRQTLYKQDQQDFGYAWAVKNGHNSSAASGCAGQECRSAHYTMQQKLRWQQLQKMSPTAARHMFLASAVNFTLAATGSYNEATSIGWLTWPGHKLSVAQQVSPGWLKNQALPAAKLSACLHAIKTPGQATAEERQLEEQMLTEPSEVQYRRQLKAYSAAGYPDTGSTVREEADSARSANHLSEPPLGGAAGIDNSTSRPQTGFAGCRNIEDDSNHKPIPRRREPVYVVISRAQLPSHVNNAQELKMGKAGK